jgi:hypothetical protein
MAPATRANLLQATLLNMSDVDDKASSICKASRAPVHHMHVIDKASLLK